jgi:DNA polymerase I
MIEALESRYRVEETSFRTIYGWKEGWKICAGRAVAEKIEIQSRMAAELYNVDVRSDLRFMAERKISPCGGTEGSRFSPKISSPLKTMTIDIHGKIGLSGTTGDITEIEVLNGKKLKLVGGEKTILGDLFDAIKTASPDVILLPDAERWMPILLTKSKKHDLKATISRTKRYRSMASRSFWSYGRAHHRQSALIPEGRILIDTKRSFTYKEGGLPGILIASRLTGLPPNLTARFTPGTLISAYEVYQAISWGFAVPFRKRDAERPREIAKLKSADKGGLILQPEPGVYENVHQIDFTSLYPTIVVKFNLSPESLDRSTQFEAKCSSSENMPGSPEAPCDQEMPFAEDNGPGFLCSALRPLLGLRIETKSLKKTRPEYSGIDSILKWMLVTSFGYTGYRNAKFGQIEVHERITAISREILMQVKETAEKMGMDVLHGIVDCLWVRGGGIEPFKERIEQETGISTAVDSYDWIAFLPMADGFGAYNRYYGRLVGGDAKVRGILSRKGDTPEYVRRMQNEIMTTLAGATNREELRLAAPKAMEIYRRYVLALPGAKAEDMVIRRRVGRLRHSRRCAMGSAIKAHQVLGVPIAPGMTIGFVIRDAGRLEVDPDLSSEEFDVNYYRGLLQKAWEEMRFALRQ